MAEESENPNAGQGSAVVLDIGGDVGALIVTMPEGMVGDEVEIVATGTSRVGHEHTHADGVRHDHVHEHAGDHDHPHPHPDGPEPVLVGEPGAPTPHVAVVVRPMPDGRRVPTLVFGAVLAGRYDLYLKPDGPVALTVDVAGSAVTEAAWPD